MDTRSINPSGDSCPDTQLSAEFIEPPARFVVAGNEGRLIPALRDAARRGTPTKSSPGRPPRFSTRTGSSATLSPTSPSRAAGATACSRIRPSRPCTSSKWRQWGATSTSAPRRTPRPSSSPKSVDCSRLWCPSALRRRRRAQSTAPSIARSAPPGRFAARWPSAAPPAPPSGGSRSRARTTCRTVRPMCRRPPSSSTSSR